MILPLLESQDQFLVNFDRIRSILNQSWANFGQKWNFDERKPANSELICSILIEFVQCNEMGDFISLELNSIMIHILSCEYHVICDHFSNMILLHEPYYVMYKSPFNCHVKSNQFFFVWEKRNMPRFCDHSAGKMLWSYWCDRIIMLRWHRAVIDGYHLY